MDLQAISAATTFNRHRWIQSAQPNFSWGARGGVARDSVDVSLVLMDVTESDVSDIPVGNVRVPREEFIAVWREAARRSEQQGHRGELDWYFGAVALTCRWMATAPLRSPHGNVLVRSPATRVPSLAFEERIEAEYLAAQNLEQRRADLAARPGWCEGVRATLRWAWRREGPPPLELPVFTPTSGGYTYIDAASPSESSSRSLPS